MHFEIGGVAPRAHKPYPQLSSHACTGRVTLLGLQEQFGLNGEIHPFERVGQGIARAIEFLRHAHDA